MSIETRLSCFILHFHAGRNVVEHRVPVTVFSRDHALALQLNGVAQSSHSENRRWLRRNVPPIKCQSSLPNLSENHLLLSQTEELLGIISLEWCRTTTDVFWTEQNK